MSVDVNAMDAGVLHYTLEGRLVPQSRPRATVLGGRVHLYELKDARDFKAYVRMATQQAVQAQGWKLTDGALYVTLMIMLPAPASLAKWQRTALQKCWKDETGGRYAFERRWCTHRPDLDNYAKSILDAITDSGAVWKDDAQITTLYVGKFYYIGDKQMASVRVRKESPFEEAEARAFVKEFMKKEKEAE